MAHNFSHIYFYSKILSITTRAVEIFHGTQLINLLLKMADVENEVAIVAFD